MPFRSKEKKREATKEAMRRLRGKGITSGITDPHWQHLIDYINRPEPEGTMPYLERHQRIAGSLGKLADQVEWGGLSVQEIKEVIGELPPLYPKD